MSEANVPIARRELIVGGALGLTALGGTVMARATDSPPRRIDPLEQIIPARMGAWSQARLGDLRLPQGENAEDGIYDQVLTRYYTSAAASPVMLLVAYGGTQSGDTSIHRPEICYPAAGFTLDGSSQVALPVTSGPPIAARRITARAPGRIEQILYWCRIGNEFPTTDFAQRLSVLRNAIRGNAPDGALVRISTINPDPNGSLILLAAFAQAMLRIDDPRARALLLGSA